MSQRPVDLRDFATTGVVATGPTGGGEATGPTRRDRSRRGHGARRRHRRRTATGSVGKDDGSGGAGVNGSGWVGAGIEVTVGSFVIRSAGR